MYVKTLGKITSLYKLGDVAACRRLAYVLCAVHITHMPHATLSLKTEICRSDIILYCNVHFKNF